MKTQHLSRADQIDRILAFHMEMKDLLFRAGVSEKSYIYPVRDIGLYTDPEVEELFDWFTAIAEKEYKELYTIFKLPADDGIWDRYITFGVTGLIEQGMFEKAAKALRAAWNKPYRPNRKIKNAKSSEDAVADLHGNSQDAFAVGIQPEGSGAAEGDC